MEIRESQSLWDFSSENILKKNMNINQALKTKNRLVSEINEQLEIAKTFNSIEKGNPRRYSVLEALAKAERLSEELVNLKVKIQMANEPVLSKIFLMSELKSYVKDLKKIPVDEGTVYSRYGSTQEQKEVEVNVFQIKEMIKEIESKISQLQDELDVFNTTTEI
jgi:predicted  nucleic acid-binding Zn-ribbon protein